MRFFFFSFYLGCSFSEISFICLHELHFFLLWFFFFFKKISKAVNVDVKLSVVISLKLIGTGTFLSLCPECLSDGPAPSGHSVAIEKQRIELGAARCGEMEDAGSRAPW